MLVGAVVVLSPLSGMLGFGALPPAFFGVLVLMGVTYLAIVQFVKQRFFQASGWGIARLTTPAAD